MATKSARRGLGWVDVDVVDVDVVDVDVVECRPGVVGPAVVWPRTVAATARAKNSLSGVAAAVFVRICAILGQRVARRLCGCKCVVWCGEA